MASNAMPTLSEEGEFAWIRTRATGQTWYVTGAVLNRALSYPEDYEILEEDDFGNFCGEEGEVVIQAPPPVAEPISVEVTPTGKTVVKRGKSLGEFKVVGNDNDNDNDDDDDDDF